MSKAFNLGQLANNINANGQLNGSTGVYNTVPSAGQLQSTSFSIKEVGTNRINIYFGTTVIGQIDSSGNLKCIGNVTAFSGTLT